MGELPQGFPPFTVPDVELADLGLLVAGALGITLVSLTDTISTSSAFAARTGQEIDADQEMIGIGAANVSAGLFQGFPVSTSGSRTAVAEQSGAKSQLTGVVGALMIAAMLLLVPGLFRNLPQPVLASVVIAASLSLADIPAMRRLWKQRRTDFAVALAAFGGVALLGVLPGIALAVVISILNVFRQMWMPYRVELGRVDGHARATTTGGSTPRARPWTGSSSSGSTRRCSSPTPGPSATRSGRWRPRIRRPPGSSWRRSRSPTSTRRPPTCSRTSTWS